MPIVSSLHTVGPLEACGRYWVKETHTDDLGTLHIREYMGSGQDYALLRAAHALEIDRQLADSEADELTNGA